MTRLARRVVPNSRARSPGRARREILVSVVGLTPQVITETLYCLTQTRRPQADISEIWVITTSPGKKRAEEALLGSWRGRFFEFCRDYGLDSRRIRFGPEQVLAIPGKDGSPLEDIRTPGDSSSAADFILGFIRKHTADASSALHCSVAGGRKTMGLYLGLALQLYGRPADTLSHVLVSPAEVESDPAFYYPPPKSGWLTVKGKRIHTRRINVELAQMPLLMLRGKLPALEEAGRSYTDLVRGAQEDYALLSAPPRAVLVPGSASLTVGGRRVRLSPLETAVYLIFAKARAGTRCRRGCDGCRSCTFAATDFLGGDGMARLREALANVKASDARLTELRGWETQDATDAEKRFREVRSRVNRKIQQCLGGEAWPALYTIAAFRLPDEDRVRYGIRLNPRFLVVR